MVIHRFNHCLLNSPDFFKILGMSCEDSESKNQLFISFASVSEGESSWVTFFYRNTGHLSSNVIKLSCTLSSCYNVAGLLSLVHGH